MCLLARNWLLYILHQQGRPDKQATSNKAVLELVGRWRYEAYMPLCTHCAHTFEPDGILNCKPMHLVRFARPLRLNTFLDAQRSFIMPPHLCQVLQVHHRVLKGSLNRTKGPFTIL